METDIFYIEGWIVIKEIKYPGTHGIYELLYLKKVISYKQEHAGKRRWIKNNKYRKEK